MSLSRFAAIGAALVAGVTLASCASSGSPIPATGLNTQVNSFAGNTVGLLQGSPQLQLGSSLAAWWIAGKLAFPFSFYTGGTGAFSATSSAFFNIPAGPQEFKITTPGTANLIPSFDQVFTLKAGTKYLVVAQGDAQFATTGLGLYQIPHYNTSNGAVAFSFFNASPNTPGYVNTALSLAIAVPPPPAPPPAQAATPVSMHNIVIGEVLSIDTGANAELVVVTAVTPNTFTAVFTKSHAVGAPITHTGAVDVWYNCFDCIATKWASGIIVGGPASPLASWNNNVIAVPSPNYCFTVYAAGMTTPVGGIGSYPAGADAFSNNAACSGSPVTLVGGTSMDFGLIDNSTPPGGSVLTFFKDQNG